MSRKINVNQGQYEVAGREKLGRPTGIETRAKDKLSQLRKEQRGAGAKESGKR